MVNSGKLDHATVISKEINEPLQKLLGNKIRAQQWKRICEEKNEEIEPHRLVRSNGTLREEKDRQDNYVNYWSIFNRRSGYKYNDLLKLCFALFAQLDSDARKAAGFSTKREILFICDTVVKMRNLKIIDYFTYFYKVLQITCINHILCKNKL